MASDLSDRYVLRRIYGAYDASGGGVKWGVWDRVSGTWLSDIGLFLSKTAAQICADHMTSLASRNQPE